MVPAPQHPAAVLEQPSDLHLSSPHAENLVSTTCRRAPRRRAVDSRPGASAPGDSRPGG
jgi:hypothetical protein